MPWYLYLALKQLFPTGRWFSFFAFVSIVGVMLGVAVLVIVQSVMNGFGAEIRDKLQQTFGHVRVETGQIIYDPEALMAELEADPGVEAINRFAEGMVLLQYKNRPSFPVVRGIDVNAEKQVIPINDFVLHGTLDDLDDETIFIGMGLAKSLGVNVGGHVEVYSPLMLDRLKADEVLLPRELEVAGIFETGYNQIDANTVVVTLRLMQELYGLAGGVHGIMLNLKDEDASEEFAYEYNLTHELPLRATTWLDANQDLLFVLSLEKNVMFFIIIFIILVASFSIASTLLTAVVRKTREIGLLGAMGGRPGHIGWVFALQGFIIGVIGTGAGMAFAFTALAYRNEFVHTLAKWTETEAALERFYQFVNLPVRYQAHDLILISVCAVGISTFAGMIPAWRAARLKPSDALRNE